MPPRPRGRSLVGPGFDYVSPLPPVRSGIADYSVDLIPELERCVDLRIVRLADQPISDEVGSRFRPVSAAHLGEGGRIPFYQMGNNVYHQGVADLARLHPGVITLHDVWLHHLLVERTLARADLSGYLDELTASHGWLGSAAALPPRWGGYGQAVLFALPANRSLLVTQRGTLVHSQWAAAMLAEELGEEWASEAVRVVPMPVPLPSPPPATAVAGRRRALQIPDGAFVIGSFGFQTPIKRTRVAVRALCREGLERAILVIGGEVANRTDLEDLARSLGVADRVRITGFLPAETFPIAIVACDVCVNLRYPTAGETSASLLRILALGRAALVSDYAQFAELPGTVVERIPLSAMGGAAPSEEVEALAAALRSFIDDEERLRRMGAAARRLVEREHDPRRAARMMGEALNELARRAPGSGSPLPADPSPPTTLTWGALQSELQVHGLEDSWLPGDRRRLELVLNNRGRARMLAGRRPEGGVVFEVQLVAEGGDLLAGRPWLPLPRDLEPGDGCRIPLALRRPHGATRLRIEPHVLGGAGFSRLAGAVWEREV